MAPKVTQETRECPVCGIVSLHTCETYSDGQRVYECPCCGEIHWPKRSGGVSSWMRRHTLTIGIDHGARFVTAMPQ